MDLHQIQAKSSTTTEAGLCLFSFQIEWVFQKADSIPYELEYRHYGMLPIQQILLNGRVISTSLRTGFSINFSYFFEGMKLQVKKYGKNYNLLINGQDFEIYVPRLKTIQELQDEPVDECPRRNNRRIEFRTFSRSEVRNTEGEAMIFSSSSPMISNFASNTEKLLEDENDEVKINLEVMQILSYFDVFQNEVFGIDLNLAASLNNINEKVNRVLQRCQSQLLMQNLQKIKRKINEIFEENMNSPLIANGNSHNLQEFLKRSIKSKSQELIQNRGH